MKWTIYYIDYSTDRVFPIPKCYACSSCKARCQTLSKHFFPPQQQPLNPCLAPVLWLLSWRHHRLPGKVEGHSCLSSFNHIPLVLVMHKYLLGWGIPWVANCWKDRCYTVAGGGTAWGPGRGVLGSSLSSETKLHVIPQHVISHSRVSISTLSLILTKKGHFPLRFQEQRGFGGFDLSAFYSIKSCATGVKR